VIEQLPSQLSLDFDGATFDPGIDAARLGKQLLAVATFMADREWHTLAEIAAATGYGEASVSARLRDLRKTKFGGHKIENLRWKESGLWHYKWPAPGPLVPV
jgi:biotin operon repressor